MFKTIGMQGTRKIFLLVAVSFFSFMTEAQERDTLMYQRDSAILPSIDQTVLFFQQAEKPADLSKTMVITKAGKTVSLATLIKPMWNPDLALTDLDNDEKKELLVYQYTNEKSGVFNAANDEIGFYKNTGNKKYQYAGKLSGGHSSITSSKEFIFSLDYYFDKFLNCSNCNFSDTSDDAPIPLHTVTVKYVKGKLTVVKGDQELRSMISDNLGKLGERAVPVDPGDGIRKEIAMNLAVYYYSFGKNLVATKTLFSKYYKQPDAKKIWIAFTKQLQVIGANVSF